MFLDSERKVLTKKEAVRLHRQEWALIAIEARTSKKKPSKRFVLSKYLPEYKNIICDCFCCEYDFQHGRACLEECVIDWGAHSCCDTVALYRKFKKTDNWYEAAKYAEQIALLPERECDYYED